MQKTDKKNLSQEEVDEIAETLPLDAKMPKVTNSDLEILTQDEIDSLLSTMDSVADEYDSTLRQMLISLRDCLRNEYAHFLDCVERLSSSFDENDSLSDDFCIDGEKAKPLWQEKLTDEQQKKFDSLCVEAEKLIADIQELVAYALELMECEELSDSQIEECNEKFLSLAEMVISQFALSSIIQKMPGDALSKIKAIRKSVFRSFQAFFNSVFSLGKKNPLFDKKMLYDFWVVSQTEKITVDDNSENDEDSIIYKKIIIEQNEEKKRIWNEFFGDGN